VTRILFIAFGFLPLWVAVAFVFIGGRSNHLAADYWNVTPWFILFSIPYCAITCGLAVATAAVYRRASGTRQRRFAVSATAFVALCVVAVLAGGGYVLYRKEVASRWALEESRALRYAKQYPSIAAAVDADGQAFIHARKQTREGVPIEYYIVVSGGRSPARAIVAVDRSANAPVFKLVCFSGSSGPKVGAPTDTCAL
jgi:hypothetical protein